ncbi:hypothetical protein CEXT_517071 [Caerostris extrusa]|uniref:Uncharacterized protein n=1 Tax=Caerostris extrusa TaxID=172846 RepID=A0AAV4XEF8_CAEEX|nr:hypothetical protein CEXT_517071 [Caerostris extrusa]
MRTRYKTNSTMRSFPLGAPELLKELISRGELPWFVRKGQYLKGTPSLITVGGAMVSEGDLQTAFMRVPVSGRESVESRFQLVLKFKVLTDFYLLLLMYASSETFALLNGV